MAGYLQRKGVYSVLSHWGSKPKVLSLSCWCLRAYCLRWLCGRSESQEGESLALNWSPECEQGLSSPFLVISPRGSRACRLVSCFRVFILVPALLSPPGPCGTRPCWILHSVEPLLLCGLSHPRTIPPSPLLLPCSAPHGLSSTGHPSAVLFVSVQIFGSMKSSCSFYFLLISCLLSLDLKIP